MAYRYYKNTLQKTEPEKISLDVVKFILKELAEQNKKIMLHKINKIGDKSKTLITWLTNEGTATIVCD